MSVMLYYPHVSPSEAALHQAVLYWDRLSTIVPEGYEEVVTPGVLRVKDAGLYRPISIGPGDVEPYDTDVAAMEAVLDELQRSAPPQRLMPEWSDSFLYPTKLHGRVAGMLLSRGLAQQQDPRDKLSRLMVPRLVSFTVVSTMARTIAERENQRRSGMPRTVPFTDQEIAHQAAHELPPGLQNPRVSPSWEVELGAFMPLPSPGTDVARLIEFRKRHDDERRRLILAVDMLVHGLPCNPDYPHDVYRMVNDYLADAARELEAAGRARKITWMYRSLSVVIALAASAAGEKFVPGVGWALGTISGMAVNVATNQVRDTRYVEKVSYLARVRRELPRLAR
jgi:hypothetical protein